MSNDKTSTHKQFTIFDALELIDERYSNLNLTSTQIKIIYENSFLELNKAFLNDKITFDEFKCSLHTLLEQYRKDRKDGFKKKIK